ncbi:hypothetical protein E0W68_03460 [Flavobacterium salilacus subsp. salilacus]|uniref:hypothetical protein n=1 Tax=Flavobacterium TaxID=237 RepID=UPI0010755D43|nr:MULTISPECIES: hypothetical protein [Flavobacterium]KAF2519419.1 hypothetical protein E0W68_03460 [Flavobacterium salilacus subsp. salilacus]MBE1614689.1 hypothetical protein [Flavobacterium sp. SaA2.13]
MNGKRKIFVLVMAGIFLLKIITLWASYFQTSYNLDNPLIPRSILEGIYDYTVLLTGIYVFAILLSILYIVTERFFWVIIAFLALTFIIPALADEHFRQYFIK